MSLTDAQIASFKEKGYLVIPNYLTPEEVTSVLTETNTLLHDFPLETHPLTQFTTGDDKKAEHLHLLDRIDAKRSQEPHV